MDWAMLSLYNTINVSYYSRVIKGFKCKETKRIHEGHVSLKFSQQIQKSARRRLINLEAATSLQDLASLPGNRIHALKHDRKGQYAMALNDQYRVCFHWRDGHAHEVEIVDYH